MRYMIFVILVAGCGGLDDGAYQPAVNARAGASSLSAPVQQAPAPVATINPSPYNNPAPPQNQFQSVMPQQPMQNFPQSMPATSNAPLVSNSPLVSSDSTTNTVAAANNFAHKTSLLSRVADTLSSWYQKAKKKITGNDE